MLGRPFHALPLLFVTVLWGGWLHCSTVADNHGLCCRNLGFLNPVDGLALKDHVIKNISLKMGIDDVRIDCRVLCGGESTCVSINIGPPTNDGVSLCQLSNSDHVRHPDDLKPQPGFLYWATKNPCNSDPCLHDATCLSGYTDKRYVCLCQAGYTGEHCETGLDIDECTKKTDNCSENAMCNNNKGGFSCSCKPGFSGDGINCADIDECAKKTENCSENAMCNNNKGGFSCSCKPGFSGDGINCADIDECAKKTENCSENAMCNNNKGGFSCSCKPGFSGDGINCADIDECAKKTDNCSENAMCNNNKGGFSCSCKPGFSGDGIKCADIDECAKKTDNCSENAMCINNKRGFSCSCKPGFSGDGINCADIDKCTKKTDNCSENAMCNNTKGSFNCSCKPGFSGDGINCADIDECSRKTDNCSENAVCNNTKGSFNCSCKSGFSGDGINCADIDECTKKTDNCSGNAVCNNTKGSFSCSCKPGFSGDGINCTDTDECTKKTDNCSENAVCNNTKGSFNCSCKPGFSGDGINCADIDECAKKTDNCSENAMCNNNKGAFSCSCKPGFSGDGINCAAVKSCKELYDAVFKSNSSQLVTLQFDSKPTPVLCHFGDFGCGDGGWTPVMKIDGNKKTFHYNSEYWSNKTEYNIRGGETGFDTQETKLPSYWNTSFSKICLGMKIGEQTNFIVINKQADSLYSLIADEQYRTTSLGRYMWKTLIGSEASLQRNCNKEGFNAVVRSSHSKARIGIISNDQNHCDSCNSRIGFGTGGIPDDSNTCGNEARYGGDNGNKNIKAMGYILVE
ncbi:uncharacterized protein LOC144636272 isoform X1 [Oculina patagonica]